MKTVDIGADSFSAYADAEDADSYLAAAIHAGTTWSAATATTKGQALVTATRVLDRQRWRDAYDTQALRFAEANVVSACIEMALALVDGSELQTEANTSQKLQSVRAGSVALTYFRGAEGPEVRFPQIVHELLRDLLATGQTTVSGVATGVSGESVTSRDLGLTGGL